VEGDYADTGVPWDGTGGPTSGAVKVFHSVTGALLFVLPIDQALCTPQLFFESREIGPALGSDHRAQELLLKRVSS
jgi:hypothetical protein